MRSKHMFLHSTDHLQIHLHCRQLRWYWITSRHLTTAIWMQESRCIMHSVWQVWHSPMHCLESYTLWHIRQVQHSQQDTFLTDVRMRSIFHMLSNTTQKIRLQQNVMLRSHAEWDFREHLRKHSSTAWLKRSMTLM